MMPLPTGLRIPQTGYYTEMDDMSRTPSALSDALSRTSSGSGASQQSFKPNSRCWGETLYRPNEPCTADQARHAEPNQLGFQRKRRRRAAVWGEPICPLPATRACRVWRREKHRGKEKARQIAHHLHRILQGELLTRSFDYYAKHPVVGTVAVWLLYQAELFPCCSRVRTCSNE